MNAIRPTQLPTSNHFTARWWHRYKPKLSTETWTAAAALIFSLVAAVGLAAGMNFNNGGIGLEIFRVLMIVTFTILPAVMYYVFIATAKANLFQEYVSNLGRLGLLRPYKAVDDDPITLRNQHYLNHMRVDSYLVRFEGVYGSVGPALENELLNATNTNLEQIDLSVANTSKLQDDPARTISETQTTTHRDSPSQARRSGVAIFSLATGIPVFLASLLIGLGWVQFIPPLALESTANMSSRLTTLASLHPDLPYNKLPALFAFLGAYFYALQMIYRRFMTNDLKASIFSSLATRIVVAVIAACVLQAILVKTTDAASEPLLRDEMLLAIAFVVGAFPPVFWRLLQNVLRPVSLVKEIVPRFQSDLPLSRLDGLTIWHQTRLEEEDIENAYNMADTHILSLMLNTKIPANRIIAWVDQAILLSCTNAVPNLSISAQAHPLSISDALGQHGIRTASALVELAAAHDITALPGKPPIEPELLQTLARSVHSYPNLELIMNWKQGFKRGSSNPVGDGMTPDRGGNSATRNRHTVQEVAPVA